jgi:hypothetical protein
VIYVPLMSDEIEDALQFVAMRCGLREVRKLASEQCDAEIENERREYLREAKRRSRARRR